MNIQPENLQRVGRYLLVGVALFLLDYAVFYLLHIPGAIELHLAQWAARITGAIAGFYLHHQFTFRAGTFSLSKLLAKRSLLYGVGFFSILLISPVIVSFVLSLVEGHLFLAKLISECLFICLSYSINHYVFVHVNNDQSAHESK
ncbi:MAG: GtrA family protein [Kordiimonadaceae bacterium]|nr:GtrA family protein [Kordiimonadaceae bacterium]